MRSERRKRGVNDGNEERSDGNEERHDGNEERSFEAYYSSLRSSFSVFERLVASLLASHPNFAH